MAIQRNPNLDKAYLLRQRDRVSPAECAAEVQGEWSSAAGSLFSRELLETHTADLELPELAALRPPAHGSVGVDWGASYDPSAAVAVFRLPVASLNPEREPAPCFVALPYVWQQGVKLHLVVEAVAKVANAFNYLAPETNGLGAMPSQELIRRVRALHGHKRVWNATATTAQSKVAGYGAILALLERDQLVLPRHPDLLRQLAGLKFEQGDRGFTRIGADTETRHDEVADALMLAACVYRPSGARRVVSHLAALALSRKAPSDANVPELESPVVTTGEGMRVWQQSPLQSVFGPELSVYGPVAPPRPTGIAAGRFFIQTTKGATL